MALWRSATPLLAVLRGSCAFVCSALQARARRLLMQILSFLPCSQCMYSNAHKETGPETAQITQRSSCLRVCEAGAAGELLQLKGAPAERQTGRRTTHACVQRRRAETRLGMKLAYTHSQRNTGFRQTHTHAYEYSHVLYLACACTHRQAFFDEMSYSDSLPRWYFA